MSRKNRGPSTDREGPKTDGRGRFWSDHRDGYGWSSFDKDEKGSHYREHHVDKEGKETVKSWDYDPADTK